MSFEDLPTEFDIAVLGTGLTATIISAAFSRIGLKVLHLDRNDYYGGAYANFNLDAIEEWKTKNEELGKTKDKSQTSGPDTIQEGSTAISLPNDRPHAFNITSAFHIRNRTPEEDAEAKRRKANIRPFGFQLLKASLPSDCGVKEGEDSEDSNQKITTQQSPDENLGGSFVTESGQPTDVEDQAVEEDSEKGNDGREAKSTAAQPGHSEAAPSTEVVPSVEENATGTTSEPEVEPSASQVAESSTITTDEPQLEPSTAQKEESVNKTADGAQGVPSTSLDKKDWTMEDIKEDWRKFCFDISPKVLFCCGDLIELLIRSDVARYCEFRSVSRVLTVLKDKLEQVPCSRSDVFGSKIVSLIEKRLMMKFLQFAADYENHKEEFEGKEETSYIDFLKSKKLTPNLQHFVQHAIAMVPDSCKTKEGLEKTKKFLQSLGRYGNTAFLFPLYGTGELSQAFSRMSAVFGGIFCLTETASHILSDAESQCCGIITSKGQQNIKCKYLVAEPSYLPQNYVKRLSTGKIFKGIYITDGSISSPSDNDLTMMNFICKEGSERPITVLEIPSSACVCPKDLYVVYLTRRSESDDPQEDLLEAEERLFASTRETASLEGSQIKPRILWSMHFTLEDWSKVEVTSEALGRVLVASEGGDEQIDVDFCVTEAERIFKAVCPDEEFLPKPPNPDDIIRGDEENTGDAESASKDTEQETEGQGGEKTEKETEGQGGEKTESAVTETDRVGEGDEAKKDTDKQTQETKGENKVESNSEQ